MKVKLSAYERAVNALNDLSPKHDKIMSAALDELRSQRDENKRLLQRAQSVIHQILEQYPHVNCVCGRSKERISPSLREVMKAIVDGN